MSQGRAAQSDPQATYDAIAERVVASGRAEFGTIMRQPCLRRKGAFVATLGHHDADGLVVKLPEQRVTELISEGTGEPLNPKWKLSRTWVMIPPEQSDVWSALVDEALDFATR